MDSVFGRCQHVKTVTFQAILFFFLMSLSASLSATELETDRLKLGVVPFKSPRAIMEVYTPVANVLTDVLGISVQVVTASSYEQYLERIYAKHYDIIVLGSTFYFKAHDKAGYQAVARGYPPFYAGIIVLADSTVQNVEQLRGKSMAAVNKNDRAGYKLQKMALLKKHIALDDDLTVHFRGDFDSVIYAVLSGQDESGAIRLDALNRLAFSRVRDRLKVIYTSPLNPQFPFAVRPDMDPVLQKKIADGLSSISIQNPENAVILQNLTIQGIERVNSGDLELLRKSRQVENKETVKTVKVPAE